MLRKITDLEQKLLDKGYVLVGKKYKGNRSQFTDSYEYCKMSLGENNWLEHFTIIIDKKRENIIDYYTSYDFDKIGEFEINEINSLLEIIREDVAYCTKIETEQA